MPVTSQLNRPPEQPVVLPEAWQLDWEISASPLLETPQEQIFIARHRHLDRAAWLHVITNSAAKNAPQWPAHFRKISTQPLPEGFAEVLLWTVEQGTLWYLTGGTNEVPLAQWKLRRQTSSATSIRMKLMLQAVQLARRLAQQGDPRLGLTAALTTVVSTTAPGSPYQLRWHGVLPPSGSDLASIRQELLTETARTLDFITAGMPWPVELMRAFHDHTQPVGLRLARCEKILLSHLECSALPAAKISPTSRWWWIAGWAALLALMALFFKLWNPATPPQSVAATPATSAVSTTKIVTSSDLPPIEGPTEITVARETLESALATKHPATILQAAHKLLLLIPQDESARKIAADLLHREARHQIDASATPSLTPKEGWGAWMEWGFEDARLLAAVEAWPAHPSDSVQELETMSGEGIVAATVMLGQLAANGRGEHVDLSRAFHYFRQAAEAGDPAGNYLLGECYLYGKGTTMDVANALTHFRLAAEGEDVRGMDMLAIRLVKGEGLERNPTEAAKWFHRAIGAGYVHSLANLAVLYLNGDGVTQDCEQALTLLRRGEKLEDPECLHLLGKCADEGTGMPQDQALARSYHERAAKLGHASSLAWLAKSSPPSRKPR